MLINTGPILIAVMAGVFLKEGFPRWLFAGCGVALAGVVLIGLANSQGGSETGSGSHSSFSLPPPTRLQS
jgi:drug/metabolite transporter (DMT)-like permease